MWRVEVPSDYDGISVGDVEGAFKEREKSLLLVFGAAVYVEYEETFVCLALRNEFNKDIVYIGNFGVVLLDCNVSSN